MIVENPSRSYAHEEARRNWAARLRSRRTWYSAILFLALFGIVLALQVASGAYHTEFGGYPDEPAHYVTGLMVRDYIAQIPGIGPREFAKEYYAHYPKVAFGHWPPLLYFVQAPWMLLFSPGRASVLLEMALLTAILAFSVYTLVKRWFGAAAGTLAAVLLVCLPEIQTYTDEIMAETLLILVSLWAAIFFARYMDSERWQDSLWFGVFSSLAIMTKGNGWEIAFVPPVALALTRKWRLLARPAFWLPVLVVSILCIPWQLWSFPLVHRGWTGGDEPNLAYSMEAMGEFLKILPSFMGPLLTGFAILGLAVTVVLPCVRRAVNSFWAVLFGLVFGVWIFHVVVPAGVEPRKMIVAVPALVLFLFAGGNWVAGRIPLGAKFAPWRSAMVAATLAVVFAVQIFAIPRETHYGFTEAAEFIAAKTETRDLTVLVSSERDGEGLLISEVAMHERRPTHTILRGTKVLASTGWTGDNYKCFLDSVADLEAFLVKAGVRIVVIDNYPPAVEFKHHRLILNAIRQNGSEWRLLRSFPGGVSGNSGQVQVYEFDAGS